MRDNNSGNSVYLYPHIGLVGTSVRERAMGRVLRGYLPSTRIGVTHGVVDLLSDTFFSLYKAEPELSDSPPMSRHLNNLLLKLLYSAPNFSSVRSHTVGSIASSLHSSSAMVGALMSDQALLDALLLQDELDKMMDQLANIQNQLGDTGDSDQQRPSGAGEQPSMMDGEQQPAMSGATKDRLEAEKELKERQIEKTQAELEKRVESIENSPLSRGIAISAADEGDESAKQLQAMMTSWGIEEGEMSYHDANELVEIANQKEDTLALIAEIGGRLAGVSAEALQSVRDSYVGAPSEPAYTRDFLRMFPMDRAYMSSHAPPVIRSLKITQWAQRGVLGLRPKAEGKKRGALVIAIDGSSSMDAHLCTIKSSDGYERPLDRSQVAKIVAIGVARAMREDRFERRRYTIFTFSIEVWKDCIVRSSDDWKSTLDWVSRDPNGGTSFNEAITYAIDELERFEHEGTLGADLLLVSDGESQLDDDIKKRLSDYRDRTGARVFYLQIVSKTRYSSGPDGWTQKKSNVDGVVDAFVVISDTDDIDDVPAYLAQQVSSVFAQVGD